MESPNNFEHLRHKPLSPLETPRPLVLACPPFRSSVNLSRIVRLAGCCGVTEIVASGNIKVDPKIARDGIQDVQITKRNSLPPALKKYSQNGFQLVGLEQTTNSKNLHHFEFQRETVLVIGSERQGITPEVLECLDATIEIPVWGMPFSYNVATATTMAVYEYCRQFPNG